VRDSVILDSSVIAAIFFKEEASERAEKALLYERVKQKRNVKLI